MASNSSREAALERRKALTNGGKKSAGRYASAPSRVRSASDARPSRTTVPDAAPEAVNPAPAVAEPQSRPSRASRNALTLSAPTGQSHRSAAKPVANASRELVLSRREALSRRGKRADSSRDRTRNEVRRATGAGTGAAEAPAKEHKCNCHEHGETSAVAASTPTSRTRLSLSGPNLSARSSSRAEGATERRVTAKRAAQYNPSRALVLARREALSKRGKSASTSSRSAAATMARQGNPDLSSRELAQKVRELKSKVGGSGSTGSLPGTCRPCGPNRNGAREAANAAVVADAHWKVGVSETLRGQVVTGTQANRSTKTTGNEVSTCRAITGTEYLGAEIFNTFCQTEASALQPAKVRVSATSHGNRVTGNEVGRSEKVTGDEPGTCSLVTGTEYVSANQDASYCGINQPGPSKVGHTLTAAGRPVSGVMVGRSEKVTGNESGSGRQLTGDQYVGDQSQVAGRAPVKVSSLQTLRGTGITGTHVGRSDQVTGDEPGSCRLITGDEYVGPQQYDRFCGVRAEPEAAKVGFSVTNRNQVVSGTRTGRSERVTGDEPGTCNVVTGTPYAGIEDSGNWCSTKDVKSVRERTPVRMGSVMTGIRPGIGGVMTGAGRGACEDISGTPYVGRDQMAEACGVSPIAEADFPQPLDQAPWQQFSVQSPARTAQVERERSGCVTGSTYEFGGKITGPFDMASDKVTGTEQFRFDRRPAKAAINPARAMASLAPALANAAALAPAEAGVDSKALSRVTGEGSGQRITGDDWDRGDRVTGTEGVSARRRNPSRSGSGSGSGAGNTAMPRFQPKRNEELPEPVSKITGSSGSTDRGSLITVSGGARG